jgi:hypothetical protein
MIPIVNLSDSFFTFAGVLVTALCGVWIAYLSNKNKWLTQSNKDLTSLNKDLSAGIVIDLLSFNDIVHKINNIFNQTPADRFLILSAMNGKFDLRVCTVLYEQHNLGATQTATLSLGATSKFINFHFDQAYLSMLKNIEKYGKPEHYITAQMEDCDLKRIYMAEKVLESKVFFLKRIKIDDENDRVFYCSYATHKGSFSQADKMTLRIYTDQIRTIMDSLIKA